MNDFDFKAFDQHLSSYKEDFQPDLDAGLRSLHGRLASGDRGAKVRKLNRRSWLGAAAAILLLLTAGYLGLAGDGGTTLLNDTDAPMAVTLPDGTEVLLQQGAQLAYAADFNETDRFIELSGQAFFQVAKDPTKPFLAQTADTELRVTGTAFNLRVQDNELEVEVSEGAVELRRQDDVTTVKANHCGLARPGKRTSLMKANNLNRHAWRTGKLTFEATPLAHAITTIRNNYGLEVTYPEDCSFPVSGAFAGNTPVAVLRTIAQLGGGTLEAAPGGAWVITDVCQ